MAAQMQRLLLLLAFTLITAMVVYRMQRLVEMSGTDGLTGLPNRTWLVHRVPRLFDAARRDGGSLTLALIDLDHFKRINDEIGHHAGDRALRHVVDRAARCTGRARANGWCAWAARNSCWCCASRWARAWERVDGLRRALATRRSCPNAAPNRCALTFSAGLAGFPHEGSDLSGLLRARRPAPAARPRRAGRNRVARARYLIDAEPRALRPRIGCRLAAPCDYGCADRAAWRLGEF